MSADAIPTRSQGRPPKRISSANSVRSGRPVTSGISKLSRRQTPKSQAKNGDKVFDPETFLARAGLGKQVVNLKKDETPYLQGDTADAIFTCRRVS